MDNTFIAKQFDTLAKLMEIYDDNPFKIRSYSQAYAVLRKVERPFSDMNRQELEAIPGIGSTIADKIIEMATTGKMEALDKYLQKTPPGILDMLNIRGFGPKKVKQIWKELEIETIGELLYACNENRIASLKGFGIKTQEELIKNLTLFESSKDKFLFAKAEKAVLKLVSQLNQTFPDYLFVITGELSLQKPIVSGIDMLTNLPSSEWDFTFEDCLIENEQWFYQGIPLNLKQTSEERFIYDRFVGSVSEDFLKTFHPQEKFYKDENEIFEFSGFPYIHPARRDNVMFLQKDLKTHPVLSRDMIRGTIHHHTTYSDGIHTLDEMFQKATSSGYEYMIITDHSKSAFYANGLTEERVEQQWREIDGINKQGKGTFLFKGIESDILNNGDLDYPDPFIAKFDCVIASVHSNLKMDIEKATSRLIKAIENPNTKILGHPTGRLLLSRSGYPLHMEYIIDACAANGVAVELNANPRRLDIDYTYLDYMAKKEVLLSVNPDAHSKDAIEHVEYGIKVIQKTNFNPDLVINTWNLEKIKLWLQV
jgi:DNA polymerase (family X)